MAVRNGLLHGVGVSTARGTPIVPRASALDQALLLPAFVGAAWFEEARSDLDRAREHAARRRAVRAPTVRRAASAWSLRLAARLNVRDGWRATLDATRRLMTARLLLVSGALTFVSFALKIWTLHVCLSGLGWSLPPEFLVLAFAPPTLAARATPLPVGVGVAEASSVGFLEANTNVPIEEALAATAVFRVVTVLLPAFGRSRRTRRDRPAARTRERRLHRG